MLERHPLSAVWGDMSEAEYAKMVEDVRERGVDDPVIKTLGDKVLDGWHRYRAAHDAGREVGLIIGAYTGDDPVRFVLGRNAHRRHLTAGERVRAALACAEWGRTNGQTGNLSRGVSAGTFVAPPSDSDIAAATGATTRTVRREKAMHRAAQHFASGEPPAPKPPTHTERLEADRDALKAEVYEKAILIEELEERVRFLEGEAKDTPHEREAIFNRQQAQISALTSQVNELTTKHEDERLRANYFKREAKSRGWKPQQQERLIDATVQRRAH